MIKNILPRIIVTGVLLYLFYRITYVLVILAAAFSIAPFFKDPNSHDPILLILFGFMICATITFLSCFFLYKLLKKIWN